MVRIFIAVFFSSLVIAMSCNFLGGKRVRGNGNIVTENRSVGAFDEVEVHGAIDVYVSQGEPGPVRVVTDENLQQYIKVESHGSQVEVSFKDGYNLRPSSKVKVYVSSPNYSRLDVSGACNIYGERKLSLNNPLSMQVSGAGDIKMEIDAPKVKARISGAGNMHMSGQTRDVEIDISGAGKAKCYDLMAESTRVEISGAGSAEVYASVFLDAQVSGAGSVKYKGNAGKVNQQVSGAGSVKKTD
jgi:hypothetical protein